MDNPDDPDDPLCRVRLLPRAPGVRHLVHAHLDAHDHLAVATDLPDGSVEIAGPRCRAAEIDAVAREIAAALGLLLLPPAAPGR